MESSAWIKRFAPLLSDKGHVLDLACGAGRHGRLFLKRGHNVLFADKDISKLNDLAHSPQAEICHIDLEDGQAWPFEAQRFDAIIVTNYLYRPHLTHLPSSLKSGGILLYETFAQGNEKFGRPRNPDFLLKPGELLELARTAQMQVLAFEQGCDGEKVVQRICAIKAEHIDLFTLSTNTD